MTAYSKPSIQIGRTMTKHLIRDPVTGRFIRVESTVYGSTYKAPKEQLITWKAPKEQLITWKWIAAVTVIIAAIIAIAYLVKSEPEAEPTYIVVRDTFELAGPPVPEEAIPAIQKEAPTSRKEIKIYRNGEAPEVVYVD